MLVRIKDFQSLIPPDFKDVFENDFTPDALELAFSDFEKAENETRRLPFIASDNSVDLHGEIVDTGAFHELGGVYRSNPVLLAQHKHRAWADGSPVIGSVRDLVTDANPLAGVAVFAEAPADQNHWLLYRDGHQRAFSVGFRVRDTEKREGRTVITKGLLLEISAVPVGANSNALVRNFVSGKLGMVASQSADANLVRELRAAIREMDAKAKRIDAFEKTLADLLGGDAPSKDADTDEGSEADDGAEGETAMDEDDREMAECLEAAAKAF